MSACSQKEELEWRSRLADHSGKDTLDSGQQAMLASLSLSIKSMGTVFGKPGRARSEHLVRTSASSMMRKLSVASIASNFTKRSSSVASLHKTAEDDFISENDTLRAYSPTRVDISINVPMDTEDLARSRLSVIPDERENVLKDSFETLPGLQVAANGSPASSLNRLAALKIKPSWGNDGHRIITPPPRTSSANSVNQTRTAAPSIIAESSIEDKENSFRAKSISIAAESQKPERKGKGLGRSSRIVPGSIRSFFR
ncbi:hypothetical protein LOCC1_G002605 [Lachnellula occidentalis]|uniref:Uncharacterized protein n=1 Tax=Lachnellula occidentalis TaxID=215460 RepID=A0A8H8RZQ5_9HELO|nr:hypothetical protein LOCC1_G002605 [Lachnellula occidentalis]